MSWPRSGNRPAILARMARTDSAVRPRMICGCRIVSHDSIAVSAAIITGSTAHRVSSKSKLKTTGAFIVYTRPVRIRGMSENLVQYGTSTLLIGSKNYSSWSLRPWLFLRKAGFEFREQIVYFDESDYQAQIAALSPSRRVPMLIDGGVKIWDSLAICEYVAEFTGTGLPRNRAARGRARSVAAEMHSGFQTLRNECPMNVRARNRRVPLTPQLQADIARVDEIWSACRVCYGAGGGWLFGEFSIADAMFAPVFFRFQTDGAGLSPASQTYLNHALQDPELRDWQDAALQEGHPLPHVERIGT